jgi:transcriptional regulator with XRE-family HTH domain
MGRVVAGKIDKHLGLRIAQARSDAGVSLDEAAAAVDMSTADFAALEAGEARISAFRLASISKYFGRTIGWFYAGLPGQSAFDAKSNSSSV